jgi:DNA invertase Pin-like site-specific DNA recombinase
MSSQPSIDLTGAGAAYIRVSDSDQDPERQRADIRAFLAGHGAVIAPEHWFQDEGWARHTADDRPDFQRLLKLAEAGRVRWIVVDKRDRFGTADPDELIHYRYLLRRWGCRLYDTQGTDWTRKDIGTVILAAVDGAKSEQEQQDLSGRVIGGHRTWAEKGEWQGGIPGFGFDVACYGIATGAEQWRVVFGHRYIRRQFFPDGTEVVHEPVAVVRNGRTRRKPVHPKYQWETQFQRLAPTRDPRILSAVRNVFERYATESLEFTDLAHFLNTRGFRNGCGGYFQGNHIERMLQDRAYIGFSTYNKRTRAGFHCLRRGQAPVPVTNPKRKERKHNKEDWIVSDKRLWDPLIDEATWEAVQAKLAARTTRPKAPRSPEEYLKGLLVCAHCGEPMEVHPVRARYEYYCKTYQKFRRNHKKAGAPPCGRHHVFQDQLDREIIRWLEESGRRLDLVLEGNGTPDRRQDKAEDHRQAFTEGVKRLETYLAEHHPDDYAAIVDEMDREAQDREQWQEEAAGDGAPYQPGTLAGAPDLVAVHARHRHDRPPALIGGTLVQRCIDCYRARVDEAQVRDELARLRAEQSRRVDEWRDLPNVKSVRDAVAVQMTALDRRITALEQQGSGLVELLEQHWRDLLSLQRRLLRAREALADERDHRRLAEALRSVIKRISLRFEAIAESRPGKSQSRLVEVTIEPVEGEVVSYPAEDAAAHYSRPTDRRG